MNAIHDTEFSGDGMILDDTRISPGSRITRGTVPARRDSEIPEEQFVLHPTPSCQLQLAWEVEFREKDTSARRRSKPTGELRTTAGLRAGCPGRCAAGGGGPPRLDARPFREKWPRKITAVEGRWVSARRGRARHRAIDATRRARWGAWSSANGG